MSEQRKPYNAFATGERAPGIGALVARKEREMRERMATEPEPVALTAITPKCSTVYVVKRHRYRDRDGWLIYSRHRCAKAGGMCFGRGWPTRIFCETEPEARRMADECRRGLPPMFDYQRETAPADVLAYYDGSEHA